MKTTAQILTLLLALTAGRTAAAEQIVEPSSEIRFEKNPTYEGKRFLCLGAGIRKKLVFRVYAIDFCVEAEAGRAELMKYFEGPGQKHAAKRGEELAEALAEDPGFFRYLMAMPVDKAANFIFVRDVSAEKMKETFVESLTKVLGAGEKARIDAFVNLLDKDIKEKDKLELRTQATGEIVVGIGDLKRLKDEKLARAVWEPYFGPSGVSPALKEAVARGVAALRSAPAANAAATP